MKHIYLLLAITVMGISLNAQDEENFFNDDNNEEIKTLFSSNENGGYGAFSIAYAEINGEDALTIGGRGGWIIGHSLSLGFGGCGYFNNFAFDENDIKYNLAGGHGGMYLEPIILPKFPVHLSIPLFVGAGGISYIEYSNNVDPFAEEGTPLETSSYFIAEPGVEVEFNMLKHFRLCLGVYYTYTTKIRIDQIKDDYPLEGLRYGLTFKFGKF